MTELRTVQATPQMPSDVEIERKIMRSTAESLESHFLAEMLKSAGLHEQVTSFGGGPGEEQFASLLRQAHADQIVAAGGLGLAESFYQAMLQREGMTEHGA